MNREKIEEKSCIPNNPVKAKEGEFEKGMRKKEEEIIAREEEVIKALRDCEPRLRRVHTVLQLLFALTGCDRFAAQHSGEFDDRRGGPQISMASGGFFQLYGLVERLLVQYKVTEECRKQRSGFAVQEEHPGEGCYFADGFPACGRPHHWPDKEQS